MSNANYMLSMFFQQGNDMEVIVRYPDLVPDDNTDTQSEFYYKDDRTTADDDITTKMYTAEVLPDVANPGASMSTFVIPSEDNTAAGAFWWRIDAVDVFDNRRTVGYGTLLVEAV